MAAQFRLALVCAILAATTSGALADSCWNHNGSLMRLQASGNHREMTYERPKASLRRAGVMPGTLLFDGVKRGNSYDGTARVFSSGCDPLEYHVSGPVSADQLRITVTGTRDVYDNCRATGRRTTDRLVFTYEHEC
ncbi:hypothetical protein [Aurantimonas sp. VKM B-3413]|uniref:hypothetical protein n=1 Tax=Aurantimonas sp. VKM B-3413 TaxID=2779401 RepID=UPI001E2AB2E9|nr:hypothetical protein [Aurantimonas sp. VKM B-3413]MCB8837825.1 hypothetical protein [Aurantimonas sp. VKM B-3413]